MSSAVRYAENIGNSEITQLQAPSLRFRDVIELDSLFERNFERVGNFYGRTYQIVERTTATHLKVVVKSEARKMDLISLVIRITISLPVTLICLLPKKLIREKYTIEVLPHPIPVERLLPRCSVQIV